MSSSRCSQSAASAVPWRCRAPTSPGAADAIGRSRSAGRTRGPPSRRKPLCRSSISSRCRRSASSSATRRIGNRPLARAANAATLLVSTDAPMPKPNVNTPAMQARLGPRIQPAIADIALEIAGDILQLAQFAEALFHEHDMRRIGGDRSRPAQRDRYIGLLQRDRVIDAVADKTDLATFPLQLLDVVRLVGGQHLGEIAVHPELLGEPPGRRLMIA